MGSALGSVVHCACARLAPTAIEPPNSSDAVVKDRNANDFNIDYRPRHAPSLLIRRRRGISPQACTYGQLLPSRSTAISTGDLHTTCQARASLYRAGQRWYGQPGTNTMHLAHGAASLDTARPRWDDAAQGGAADGAPQGPSEPPAVRGGRGCIERCTAGGVWAVAGAGAGA